MHELNIEIKKKIFLPTQFPSWTWDIILSY